VTVWLSWITPVRTGSTVSTHLFAPEEDAEVPEARHDYIEATVALPLRSALHAAVAHRRSSRPHRPITM